MRAKLNQFTACHMAFPGTPRRQRLRKHEREAAPNHIRQLKRRHEDG